MTELYHWFDLLGVMVFAISGTLLAHRKHMDGFGVVVLATVTGIGGGTIRDMILDTPVFWLHDSSYFIAIFSAVILCIWWLNRQKIVPKQRLLVADAFGLAFFAVMGMQKAMSLAMPDTTVIIMGVLTGCFGGVIRDVLADEMPMLLKGELYAITCIIGGIIYTQLTHFEVPLEVTMVVSMLTILLLRLAAIRWNLVLHVFKYNS